MFLQTTAVFLFLNSLTAFNIDTKTPYLLRGNGGDHFGFSVALHKSKTETKLLIGAPTADTSQPGISSAGAIYGCNIPSNMETPRNPVTCSSQIKAIDSKGNKFLAIAANGNPDVNPDGSLKYNYREDGFQQENKTGQWMGVSLRSNGDYVVACAHRFIRLAWSFRSDGNHNYDTQPIGKCTVLGGDLEEQVEEYTPCWGRSTGYELASCQVGTGLGMSADGAVFGGPGAYRGEGKAYMSPDLSKGGTVKTENYRDAGQGEAGQWYTGYSTALCDLNGDGKDDVITAAPRAQGYLGKLLVYTKTGDRLNRQAEVDGGQIGEYFGYSLDCGDFNGDGFMDVIVGAPFYSKDTSGLHFTLHLKFNHSVNIVLHMWTISKIARMNLDTRCKPMSNNFQLRSLILQMCS